MKTHFKLSLSEGHAVYEIMWKSMMGTGRLQTQYGSCALNAGQKKKKIGMRTLAEPDAPRP